MFSRSLTVTWFRTIPSKSGPSPRPAHRIQPPGIHARIPRNGPSRAGPALGSTRARGKDDSSLQKLPQKKGNIIN